MWDTILVYHRLAEATGTGKARRRAQDVKWMHALIEERATARLRDDPAIRARLLVLEQEVGEARLLPEAAAEEIAEMLEGK